MTPLSEPPVCPACGLVLPPGLPASACPRCLLGAGMAGGDGGTEEVATKISGQTTASQGVVAELTEGAVIDRYRIGRRVGRGGMGEVYAAEQVEPVKRSVAFKVIKRGMDTDHIIARFQTERQSLALMDHPNIAVVLDAGATPAGRPYFVMEFVLGVPLTTYCDDKQLPLRARLDLFLQVCGAIQHAHQKGIIHRDLKPSNILVSEEDGQPLLKVIDFGLAKATGQDAIDRTLLTEAGQVLGTPAYMSPEQAGGNQDLDTRADVYALGAILYELITGEPPFGRRRLESAAWEEILRLIREEEPPRPSARVARIHRYGVPASAGSGGAREGGRSNAAAHEPPEGGTPSTRGTSSKGATPSKSGTRSIPADLDWIVMKAIEKERARRYETVSGLAGDVRHFLAHEPVNARPPTAAYRLGKFVRRHRRSLATAAVLTAGLLSTAGVWIKSEWEERQRATQLSQQVLGLVAEAERLMQENDRVDYDNDEPFRRALELSDRAKALLGREVPDAPVSARLDPLLAAVGREHDDRQLIGKLEEVSISALSDEDLKATLSRYQQVLSARGIELGRLPVESIVGRWASNREAVRSRLAAELAEMERWALRRQKVDREPPLHAWLRQVVDTIDPDDDWRNQFRAAGRIGNREALVKLAESPGRNQQPVVVLVQLAGALKNSEDRARSISLLKEIGQDNPSNFRAHLALGMTMAEALNSIDGRSEARVGGTNWALTARSTPPGQSLLRRRDYDEAVGHLTAAVALRPGSVGAWVTLGLALAEAGRSEEAIAAHSKAIELQPDLAMAHLNLGVALLDKGEWDRAIAEARRAIELRPDLAAAHYDLGNAFQSKGELDSAIGAYLKAIELQPDLVEARSNLGITLQSKGDLAGAIVSFRKAIDLQPDLVEDHMALSVALKGNGDTTGAIAAARKVIELKPDWAEAQMWLGVVLGDEDAAIAALRKAIELKPDLAEAHMSLGNAFQAKGDFDGALASFRKAIELRPDDAEAHNNLGNALQARGELDEAVTAQRKAIELKPGLVEAHLNLGLALYDKADWDGAIGEARKAIELKPGLGEAHMNLGNALQAKGDWDGALASAREAIGLKPELAMAHNNLGVAISVMGDLDGAIAAFRKAIELKPDLAMAHNNLGLALASSGAFSAALDSFERALASDQSGSSAQRRAQSIGAMKSLMQREADLVARLTGAPASDKPPARAEHEVSLDALHRGLGPQPTPGSSVLREYAESHREKLQGALGRATIQMITIPKAGADGTNDLARKPQLAAELRRKAAGGANFGELASSYSADSFASAGGRREITRVSLKKLLSDAAFALKPGQLSPVIEDEGNFYLIRMVERQAPNPKAINLEDPEVRSAIAALIEAERREAWKEKFWRQCLEKARAVAR